MGYKGKKIRRMEESGGREQSEERERMEQACKGSRKMLGGRV